MLTAINIFKNHQLTTSPKPESLLLITTFPDEELIKLSKNLNFDKNIYIYGIKFINKIMQNHSKYTKNLIDDLYNIKIKDILTSKPDLDWKKERQSFIEKLKYKFNEGNFSLLLGAGVSCDANLPSWEQLISSLLIKSFSETQNIGNQYSNHTIKRVSNAFKNNQFNSALLSARYLKKSLTKKNEPNEQFKSIIHEVLYNSNPINRNSKLIEVIGRLCIPTRMRAHIDSIITYNFDDLVEQNLSSKNLDYHVICNSIETSLVHELPIYHVHGFIPENSKNYSNINSEIVFSEDGYHKIYSDPYHWSNLVTLGHLREKSCLMIGLSMDDPNLRRLLDIVSNPSIEPKHYALLQRVEINKLLPEDPNDTERKLAVNFLNSHHQLQAEIFRDLGVNIIWYEKYSDIPEILEMLLH